MGEPMRERASPLRRPPGAAADEAQAGAPAAGKPLRRGVVRGLAIGAVVAAFLILSGAFGTGEAPLGARAVYWLTLMLAGSLLGAGLSHLVMERLDLLGRWPLAQGALLTAVITAVGAPLVMGFTHLMFGGGLSWGRLLAFSWPVAVITAAMTTLNFLAAREPPTTHAAPAGAAPPRFLDRLPPKLRGAELYAVAAEDHYLRLHTSRGQDLILMRLSDAVAELEGLEGAQTHRSWWVARGAVTEADRGDGRAVLTLKDGAKAPVSRTYAKALRAQGWF